MPDTGKPEFGWVRERTEIAAREGNVASAGDRVQLGGSHRKLPSRGKLLGAAEGKTHLKISVRLRSRVDASTADDRIMALGAQKPSRRRYLSREEYASRHGVDPVDVAKVEAFAKEHGLTVHRVHTGSRIVKLEGTVAAFSTAFGVKLNKVKRGTRELRVREGAILIPASLKDTIVGVHGLDNRAVARPHFPARRKQSKQAKRKRESVSALPVPEVARLYNYPSHLSGEGQCIALIELNMLDKKGRVSGTGFKRSDIATFFKKFGLPIPEIVSVGVDGGGNKPGKSKSDGEVVLDIEVAGAVAPGAKIAIYFAPNTTNGFIDAVNAAVHDKVRRPSIISISWGWAEDELPGAFIDGMNEAFRAAAALGITICAAAGDFGSAGMQSHWDGKPHVEFPSSSPLVLACGGTTLEAANGKIKREIVWNQGARRGAGGGGVSNIFPLPPYQKKIKAPKSPDRFKGRGVPDVAANADRSGYQAFLNGRSRPGGGTSAVAPLMAGLIARINEHLVQRCGKTAGFINPLIYKAAGNAVFRDITTGNNDLHGNLAGKYRARVGWDPCSGLGVADGAKLLKLLS
jgi:kumamolisin